MMGVFYRHQSTLVQPLLQNLFVKSQYVIKLIDKSSHLVKSVLLFLDLVVYISIILLI